MIIMLNMTVSGERRLAEIARNFAKNNVKDEQSRAIKEIAFASERGIKQALTVGETRAIDTGLLRASTRLTKFTSDEARVGPNVDYDIFVHEGTRFMRARPFIPAGVKMAGGEIKRIIEKSGSKIVLNLLR